jgi:hypothetical protein
VSSPGEARPAEAVEAVRATAGGIAIRARVTPRAGGDAVAGTVVLGDGRRALAVRLAAAPVADAANRSLARLIARELGVPRAAARVVAGRRGRVKSVAVAGDSTALAAAARALLGRLPHDG